MKGVYFPKSIRSLQLTPLNMRSALGSGLLGLGLHGVLKTLTSQVEVVTISLPTAPKKPESLQKQ